MKVGYGIQYIERGGGPGWDVVMVVGWGILDREARWDVEGA